MVNGAKTWYGRSLPPRTGESRQCATPLYSKCFGRCRGIGSYRTLLVPHAYEDRPLPIGYGQTISQPYIVAKMTELLGPKKGHRVLEIGTGSGYQAAILSRLVANVYTVEIVNPLGTTARERLAALGYKNVEVRVADGYYGWPEKAPFDCIVVTAAANHIPPPLIEQLKPGGRLVVPIGNPFQTQRLVLVTKGNKGPRDIRIRDIMPVRFVPLVSGSSGQ